MIIAYKSKRSRLYLYVRMYVGTDELEYPFLRMIVKDDILNVETHDSSSKLKVSYVVSDRLVSVDENNSSSCELVGKYINLGTEESKSQEVVDWNEVRTRLHFVLSHSIDTLNEIESEEIADFQEVRSEEEGLMGVYAQEINVRQTSKSKCSLTKVRAIFMTTRKLPNP